MVTRSTPSSPLARSMLALLGAVLVTAPAGAQTSLSGQIAAVKRQHAQQAAASRAAGRKMTMLQGLFHTRVSVEFNETPVTDALEYLRTASGVHLVGRYLDDRTGVGIDPEIRITLDAIDQPAIEVLELVLEQCADVDDCTWQLRKSFVEVGTKERLSLPAARELRTYPVEQLLFEAPRFDNSIPMGFGYGYPGSVGTYDNYATNPGYAFRPGAYGVGASGAIGGAPARPSTGDDGSLNGPEATAERAEELIEFIVGIVEPTLWVRNGGDGATILYRDGALFVQAPEFVHRAIAGYPPIPPPAGAEAEGASENDGTKQPPNAAAPRSSAP